MRGDDHRHLRREAHPLPQRGFRRIVGGVGIERGERRYRGAQHIHRVRPGRKQAEHFQNGVRQASLSGEIAFELAELLHTRQLTVQEQPCHFLEARLFRKLVNVVSAVEQARIGMDPADGRFAGDNAREPRAVGLFDLVAHVVPPYGRSSWIGS